MTPRSFAFTTDATTYAVAVDDAGLLRTVHWGDRIDAVSDLVPEPLWDLSTNDQVADIAAEEYALQGGFRVKEPGMSVVTDDGGRELRPRFAGTDDTSDHPILLLEDNSAGVRVALHYRTHPRFDLIERWAEVTNTGSAPLELTSVASAQVTVPFDELRLHQTTGHWAAELQPFTQRIGAAPVVLTGRKGVSSHAATPSFILDRNACETAGQVWFGALRWPGAFRTVIEPRPYGGTLITIGAAESDLRLPLAPGQTWRTPAVVLGYTAAGLGGMSHLMHDFVRSQLRPEPRMVLYNSWEATGFDVTEANQQALAERAARVGAELFVVDDGWFGRRGEPGDGLGDWTVNRTKFPDGLAPLIAAVQRAGMAFGLWVEPEMVSPNSDLYRAHPDWIHREPGVEPDTARDQYVLDLSLPQVEDFVVDTVCGLLAEYDIAYLKWDANRPMSAVAGSGRRIGHTQGLLRAVTRIRTAFPDVWLEACASGGGRTDLGTLSVFDDCWTSDNTDALDRLTIQRGFSMLMPVKAMRAWITDSPNFLTQRAIPLRFRAHVAMMGTLGIGADLNAFDDDALAELAGYVATYKSLRNTIQDGRFDRLDNPSANDYQLFSFTDDQRVVLFAFLPAGRIGRRSTRVRLRGLDPAATYTFRHQWRTQHKTGAYLMAAGIDLWLQGDYASDLIVFDREPPAGP